MLFTIKLFWCSQKNYGSKNVKDNEKKGRDYKQFELMDTKDQIKKLTKT